MVPHIHRVPSVLVATRVQPDVQTLFQLVPPAIVCTGEDTVTKLFLPSCPLKLQPHTHRVPSVLIAAVAASKPPTDTLCQLVPPLTVCVGLERDIALLVPSEPAKFVPHNHRVPSVLTAAIILDPMSTLRQLVPPLIVCTGLERLILAFVPKTPLLSGPQAHKPPSKKQSFFTKASSKSALLQPRAVSVNLKPEDINTPHLLWLGLLICYANQFLRLLFVQG